MYCTPHDNGYSSLFATLAERLDLFNSILGVLGDDDKKPRSVQLVDQELGVAFRTNSKGAAMVKPRVLSSTPVPGGSHFEMTFPDQESVDNFVAQQKALGNDVQILRKGERSTFFAGTGHVQKKFGGAFAHSAWRQSHMSLKPTLRRSSPWRRASQGSPRSGNTPLAEPKNARKV